MIPDQSLVSLVDIIQKKEIALACIHGREPLWVLEKREGKKGIPIWLNTSSVRAAAYSGEAVTPSCLHSSAVIFWTVYQIVDFSLCQPPRARAFTRFLLVQGNQKTKKKSHYQKVALTSSKSLSSSVNCFVSLMALLFFCFLLLWILRKNGE